MKKYLFIISIILTGILFVASEMPYNAYVSLRLKNEISKLITKKKARNIDEIRLEIVPLVDLIIEGDVDKNVEILTSELSKYQEEAAIRIPLDILSVDEFLTFVHPSEMLAGFVIDYCRKNKIISNNVLKDKKQSSTELIINCLK